MSDFSPRTLASSLDKLQLSTSGEALPQAKKPEPVDSWEDAAEEEDADTEGDLQSTTPIRHITTSDYPRPPPPTPASPSCSSGTLLQTAPYQTLSPYALDGTLGERASGGEQTPARRGGGGDDRRPDKSTAVASRLIAAGIGQKAPRRTKEQREYDQAMKIQEKKRREQAKAEDEARRSEKEKAMRAIWDD
ncbi:hypothetical protein M433DRAFT_378966 [Acidomyces richmondensis BFW]|nr:hypothetical protein M433DRAFT_378966 [Acidomyces richmondensis BFW]